MMNHVDKRLIFFQEILSCISNIYIWKYDPQMNLLSSNCPDETILNTVLLLENHSDYILKHAASSHTPLIFSNTLDMNWTAFYEKDGETLLHIYLLGPVFSEADAIPKKEVVLNKLLLPPQLKHQFMNLIETIPVIAIYHFVQFSIMMHYCITQEKISSSDFQYYTPQYEAVESNTSGITDNDHTATDKYLNYLYEQRLMKIVEEGNVEYLSNPNQLMYPGIVGKLSNKDSLRQMKNMINISIALFMRASIRGGLSIETAYTLSDHYIQAIEDCQSTSEIIQINHIMQQDFIQRVHDHKIEHYASAFAKRCCDYIDLHIEDDFSIHDLAKYIGYTEHYIGKKFKAEMNISLKQYINQKRVEYAKLLLRNTSMSISDISERLHFCSTSYFTQLFHEITTLTPTEFRG